MLNYFTPTEQLFLKFLYAITPYIELVRYCVTICDLLNTAQKCVIEETKKIDDDRFWVKPKSAQLIKHLKAISRHDADTESIFKQCFEAGNSLGAVVVFYWIYVDVDAKSREQFTGTIIGWPVDVRNVFFKLLAKFKHNNKMTNYLETYMKGLLQALAPARQWLM